MDRQLLYKAAKHEVEEFSEDCGMNLAEMWDMVKGNVDTMNGTEHFWYITCLMDYESRNAR